MDENQLCFFEESRINCNYDENDFFTRIYNGRWQEILQTEEFKAFLSTGNESFTKDQKLAVAIACLLAFTQHNFTGPDLNTLETFRFETIWNIDRISVDGIEINTNIEHVLLLFISQNILEDLSCQFPSDIVIKIWNLRLIKVFQRSLDEDSVSIYDKLLKIHQELSLEKLNEIKNERFRFLVQLEVISIFLMYRRVNKVADLLKEVKEIYKIEMIEQGVLGMRTKWQQKALPQFHVSIEQNNADMELASEITHRETALIELLKHNDDTLLETMMSVDSDYRNPSQVSSSIQNFVLITARHLEISQPKDKLANEMIEPYLRILLAQKNGPWMIRLDALLMNIKIDANHRRTVERSLQQCEDIVMKIKEKEGQAQPIQRFSYVFSSLMIPRHKIEAQLASLMISLGLIKGALDVYLRIQHWEEVIDCYTRLELRHKAAEIIQQELEKLPTVKLYCLLGDATDDVKCYEKAWEFSNHRSGLAQRYWGNYFFAKHEYAEAIPHLQKSLEINSLQETLWMRLGYAALDVENYELAASAYVRYTQLEPDGFEAWNNLAKCYIKLGNKQRAHKIFQESLKCNFDNWKIWENFLLVSVDVGCFEDALNAYNRLIELKNKYFDEEVLTIIMKAIANDLTDAEGLATSRLRKKALEMLAHLGSIHSNEGVVWELSAMLTNEPLKKAEKLQKAHKGYVSKSPDWAKDETIGLTMLKLCENLCEVSLEASKTFEEREKMLVLSQLSSARLTAQSCVKVAMSNEWESCRGVTSNINQLLERIVLKIKELK
ncbi:CLUMA_CG007994, isoform A [Clunio marinus]|uniref:CLUMA_CG007994, isoform A n=1 Tax=Clunio marinus TaxID=568069 RepID=A0A1J1I2F7_9DIPT|nr:CLUMA_CG007994, isoform A [Clunio marinus]